MTKNKKPKSVFCVIGADDNLLGYFKTMEDVSRHLYKENAEEAVILEVIAVIDASFPPEPELELTDRSLESLL